MKTKTKTKTKRTPKRWPTSVNGNDTSTSASRVIDAHYNEKGVRDVWTLDRVERMARALNITVPEISSIIAYPHSIFLDRLKRRKVNGPACVLLTLIEHAFLSGVLPDTIDLFNFNENGRPKDT